MPFHTFGKAENKHHQNPRP